MPIQACSPCRPHEFQDRKYGGKRVYNKGKGKKTCTVCGKVETVIEADKKK